MVYNLLYQSISVIKFDIIVLIDFRNKASYESFPKAFTEFLLKTLQPILNRDKQRPQASAFKFSSNRLM